MRPLIALLLCSTLAAPVQAAPAASAAQATEAKAPASVELRILGQGKPASIALDKTSQVRQGKRVTAPGSDVGVFTGTILTLKPTLTPDGEIAYEGTLEAIDFLGFDNNASGATTVQTRSEKIDLKGVLANHQATAVTLPKLGRTVYFAIDDPARPKKDCAACGPRDKGELAKPGGS